MTRPKHLLVLRLSSLGDVAMTLPVIRNLLQQHPGLRVTMVSAALVKPLFENIERLTFFAADLKGRHNGLPGLYRLFKEVNQVDDFDAVADLHDVLRTKILRRFFLLPRKPVAVIDKGRKEKKELTRPQNKKLHPLKSTFERYADVFRTLHLPLRLEEGQGLSPKGEEPKTLKQLKAKGHILIGLAPIAQYAEKTYPLEKMKDVVRLLARHKSNRLFLFGGKSEQEVLASWQAEFTNVKSFAGEGLQEELSVIAHLDLMVSMDSANMHLASMFGVPVVSVWGGTHPYLGFMGWGQRLDNAVQIDLPCRPSSVFGNKACPNNCACLNGIPLQMIYDRIVQQLNQTNENSSPSSQ